MRVGNGEMPRMRSFLLAAALASGCTSEQPTCNDAARGVAKTLDSRHAGDLRFGADFGSVLAERCRADEWSASARACFANLTGKKGEACGQHITASQQRALAGAVEKLVANLKRPVSGPREVRFAPPPPPAPGEE
jgi:hypothetical protein